MVVTDDIAAANRILPEVKAYHFDLAGDYTVIKNAYYLILSNSTFCIFPDIYKRYHPVYNCTEVLGKTQCIGWILGIGAEYIF